MRISALILENFRNYRRKTSINFNDLTVLIGKNDVGKSSILEALDIFFENRSLDKNDVNIDAALAGEPVKICVVFDNLPQEIDLDAGAKTNLVDEYLLNPNGVLEIKKEYNSLSKPKTYIVCYHPNVEPVNNLHSLKIGQLQKLAKELGVAGDFKLSVKNELRKAIWNHTDATNSRDITAIEISQEGIKDIWDKIKEALPIYALFQADRKNDEKDSEVQDPLKVAAEQALRRYYPILNKIKLRVEKEVTQIASLTIDKLKEMNKEVADNLVPKFADDLKWADLFKPTLTSDNIPMNKRGSGVRRLLLINFFRAEAERKRIEQNLPNVIYAIEEPETSQHPDWQIKLIDALKELAVNGTAQIITTTHSPALASIVPVTDLRFIFRLGDENKIEIGSEENFTTIANTLGLMPNVPDEIEKLKLILCLEGPTDIEFFNNISHHFGLDILNDKRILVISLGGGTLGHWVTHNYLKKLNKPEIHIYDNDVAKYQKFIDKVLARENNSWGTLTKKREIENYVHPSLLTGVFQLPNPVIDIEQHNWLAEWDSIDVENVLKRQQRTNVKMSIATNCAKQMTPELLKEIDAYNEMEEWFNQIKSRIN